MIEYTHGNIFDADVEALVNPVNCVGVMGAGLAKQFKSRYPGNYKRYKEACRAGRVIPQEMFISPINMANPKYIINFPTKRHWKDKSQRLDIKHGLAAMRRNVDELGIKSLAMSALGCGLSGLSWEIVKDLIEKVLWDWDVKVVICYSGSFNCASCSTTAS